MDPLYRSYIHALVLPITFSMVSSILCFNFCNSLGQNIQKSINLLENFFVVFVSILGLLILVINIIGAVQVGIQSLLCCCFPTLIVNYTFGQPPSLEISSALTITDYKGGGISWLPQSIVSFVRTS